MSADLVQKLADMMAMIAKSYNEMGATIISMDEPSLNLMVGKRKIFYHKEETIIQILNRAIATITKYSSIHICGPLAPKLRDILLATNVKILDHEFTGGANDLTFEKAMFEKSEKSLAYGVLESSLKYKENGKIDDFVETSESLEKRIQHAIDTIGKNNLIFKPDCGFGGLRATFGQEMASEIVRRKLKNLSTAMKKMQ
jgi:methionine synthase II (cobalamin-independent)